VRVADGPHLGLEDAAHPEQIVCRRWVQLFDPVEDGVDDLHGMEIRVNADGEQAVAGLDSNSQGMKEVVQIRDEMGFGELPGGG
jgi:hypothetical protein